MTDLQRYAKYLFVSDVDGTLAHFQDIPRRNVEVIEAFIAQGGIFSICTGRAFASLREMVHQVAVNAPVVTLNGATLYDWQADRPLFTVDLPPAGKEILAPVLEAFPEAGVMLVTEDNYFVLRDGRAIDPQVEAHLEELIGMMRHFKICTPETAPKAWSKYIFHVPPVRAQAVVDFCKNLPGADDLAIFQTQTGHIDVMSAQGIKGQGLRRLADHMGIDLAHTGAVGDHYNDLDMLETAAWSAAVQGAPDALIQAADYVTCSFEQGATGDALERFMAWIDK